MKPKFKKIIARQLPFYTRRPERILWRALKKQQQKIRSKNYPLIACVPSDAIGQEIVMYGLYEEKLLHYLFERIFSTNDLKAFKQHRVIDVGANIGNHSLFFSRYFKQVIAFEPNPIALKLLETNIFLNKIQNIQVIPVGLSNESTILPFLDDLENLGGSGFNFSKQSLPTQRLKVEKGDLLLKNMDTSPIALIKLDIEGHELKALQGLRQTINSHQPVLLFEAVTSKGKNGSKAVFNYLLNQNYKYFYTVEEKKPHPFFLLSFFEKLRGFEIVLQQIYEPENRYYSLIIAKTSPLSITT